ncbi:hypothetical protein [Spirosoma foliorum]|uniref:Secreted protein n=1 Tax=Spirosoma foliorum TaxID=2710596 RepID=A0A7G5H1M7_9BACT|nr:hypothetical protein [Spirosoma foliorum]QMW05019.1 hypothetical protein H3H32_09060 [Spirosoma foliorum]
MKGLLLPSCIYILCSVISFGQGAAPRTHHSSHDNKRPEVATVLVCGSRSANAYHDYECHGLNRCRSGVSLVSEARTMGYVPCKICY